MGELFGGIEAGGTKVVCAVGSGPDDLRAQARFPTTTPEETLGRALDFLRSQAETLGPLAAVGVASFGPLDLDRRSATFGCITSTPKPGWADTDLVGPLQRGLGVPIALDTDVNAAALGEWRWGAGQGLDTLVYLTIGTGIGGGGIVGGQVMHGLLHPEMGHIRVPHDRALDPFEGSCPFHGDCLEGLASGPAIEQRWGVRGESLADDHPAWELVAHYLALGVGNLICTLSPRRVILAGGVMERRQLFPLIRAQVVSQLNGYVQARQILEGIDAYIVPPGLGPNSGILGALALARRTETHRSRREH